jgi:hypothetical protein
VLTRSLGGDYPAPEDYLWMWPQQMETVVRIEHRVNLTLLRQLRPGNSAYLRR